MSDSAGAPKLFISYRRDETPVSAAWLYEVLVERFGESSVFMDLTLKPGEDFVELTQVDLTTGRRNPLTSEPTHFNGIDVGTNNGGDAAVVATICSSDEECDVHRRQDGTFTSEDLAPERCKAVRPSMSQGTILFSLEGADCEETGLYTYKRGETDQLTPQRTQGADIDGDTAVAIKKPRALQLHDLTDDDLRPTSLQLPEGHEPWGPVVVDGEYVTFSTSSVPRTGSRGSSGRRRIRLSSTTE